MKRNIDRDLPLEACNVSVELVREIEDEETGELVEEHIIDVFGRFLPAELDVGIVAPIEVLSAHREDTGVRIPVELDDWEVDGLVDLLRKQNWS